MGSFTELANSWWSSYGRELEIKYRGGLYKPSVFADMLVAEHALRGTVQREEMLQHKVQALQKAADIEPEGKIQLAEANSQLDESRVQCYHRQQALYRAEAMFPTFVKRDYDILRTDDVWYMREEMVRDCSDRGGCCSRGCGCCVFEEINHKDAKGGVTVLQSAGAARSNEASSFQMRKRKRFSEITRCLKAHLTHFSAAFG